MSNSRLSFDDHSIWASRPSLDHETTPLQRRARAGTLPSSLPSRHVTQTADPSHHGSLALISPDGNDIVYGAPNTNTRSAVGQQIFDQRRTPPLASIPEPAVPQISEPSSNSRTRSGSLNSLAAYRPFGQSIWDAPSAPSAPVSVLSSSPLSSLAGSLPSSLGTPVKHMETSGGLAVPGAGAGTTHVSSPGHAGFEPNDPLMLFANELNKTAAPNRMRSYTLDGSADWGAPPQSAGFARNRAQTLLGAGRANPPIALGRFGKQHQLPHEAAAFGGVQLGDPSPVPTPALWVSNVPPQATSLTLHSLFNSFGQIESARVVPSRRCAYVLFASTVQAIEAQATANGSELYTGNGPSAVAFAQVSPTPSGPSVSTQPGTVSGGGSPNSAAYILQMLGADRQEVFEGVEHLNRAAKNDFNVPLRSLNELLDKEGERQYNTAALRELRRKLEHQALSPSEIADVALDMQAELPVLVSDYIGNTVVQLVFEGAPTQVRDMMLRRLGDVFAATGMHKNGTWAVQKMIDLARGPRQYELCAKALQPHLVPLLLDQYGNYVVQGCLKFGAPYSDFVYAGIAASLAKIAPNRFGARAVRAVLDSPHTTIRSQRIVATAIVQQLPMLATNPNGSLLVMWLLSHPKDPDTDQASEAASTHSRTHSTHSTHSIHSIHSTHSTQSMQSTHSNHSSQGSNSPDPMPAAALAQQMRTHALVAAQLIPQHLVALCTSKLGSGIAQRIAMSPAPAASQRIFDALFEPLTDGVSPVLLQIISDPTGQGSTCMYRLVSGYAVGSIERQVAISKVRAALQSPGAVKYRRLMEEVGLETEEPDTDKLTTIN